MSCDHWHSKQGLPHTQTCSNSSGNKTVLVAAKIIAPSCKNEPLVVTSLLNNHASKHLLYYSMNFAEAVVTTDVELNVLVQSVYYIKDMMRNLFQESRFELCCSVRTRWPNVFKVPTILGAMMETVLSLIYFELSVYCHSRVE